LPLAAPGLTEKLKNLAVIYVVDLDEVPDFNKMYELYDPCTLMFFFRNKHMMIGTFPSAPSVCACLCASAYVRACVGVSTVLLFSVRIRASLGSFAGGQPCASRACAQTWGLATTTR
jgi:hypothetical protein